MFSIFVIACTRENIGKQYGGAAHLDTQSIYMSKRECDCVSYEITQTFSYFLVYHIWTED